jgi:hypothetical protein
MRDDGTKRSVSLLGLRAVEKALQQELTARFPRDRFPVDLNVVGGLNRRLGAGYGRSARFRPRGIILDRVPASALQQGSKSDVR